MKRGTVTEYMVRVVEERIDVTTSIGYREKDPNWEETCEECGEKITWELGLFTGHSRESDDYPSLPEYFCGNCGLSVEPATIYVPPPAFREFIQGQQDAQVMLRVAVTGKHTDVYRFSLTPQEYDLLRQLHASREEPEERKRLILPYLEGILDEHGYTPMYSEVST